MEDKVEREYYNNLLNNDKTKESDISKHLTQGEAEFVKLYSSCLQGKDLSDPQREYLAKMLEKSIGNSSLNKKLTQFSREKHNASFATYKESVKAIKYFSHKTKSIEHLSEVLQKCESNFALIEAGKTVNESQKLTHYEYGLLYNLQKAYSKLESINKGDLLSRSANLSTLYEQGKKVDELINRIDLMSISNQKYQAGDLLMTHNKKSFASKDRKGDAEERLTDKFVSSYGHAAPIYIDPKTNKPHLSDIYEDYRTIAVVSRDVVTSDIFRINPVKLITNQELLNKLKVDNDTLNKMYQDIAQKIHETKQEHFKPIENDTLSRFRAGLADLRLFGGHSTNNQSFKNVHESMLGYADTSLKDKMICSEFASRVTITTFVELNNQLRAMAKKQNIEIPEGEDLVTIPFSKKERLENIHPERLVRLLQKSGCLEEVPRANVLDQMISQTRFRDYAAQDIMLSELIVDGKKDKVKELLDNDPKMKSHKLKVEGEDKPFLPLGLAAKQDQTDILRLLLDKKAPINAKGPSGTALHIAIEGGNIEAVSILLQSGADPHIKHKGKTAYQMVEALGQTNIDKAQELQKIFIKEKVMDPTSTKDQIDVPGVLSEDRINVMYKPGNKYANTDLHQAVKSLEDGKFAENFPTADFDKILDYNIQNINKRNNKGLTPIALCTDQKIRRKLVRMGADPKFAKGLKKTEQAELEAIKVQYDMLAKDTYKTVLDTYNKHKGDSEKFSEVIINSINETYKMEKNNTPENKELLLEQKEEINILCANAFIELDTAKQRHNEKNIFMKMIDNIKSITGNSIFDKAMKEQSKKLQVNLKNVMQSQAVSKNAKGRSS